MSKIVVSGYYGFKNAGDEAMLAAMIEALTDIDPEVNITVISAAPNDTKKRHGVESVSWLNYFAIAKAIRTSDLVVSGGGSLLQNVTSGRSLYYYLSILLLAKIIGTPVMLYAQGIGPICGSFARRVMHIVCNMMSLITVRDQGSLLELESLGVTRPAIALTADPVLAIHRVDRQIGRAIFRKNKIEGAKPLVGISVREWRGWTHYKEVLASVVDTIGEKYGARVVFLPMQYPEDVAAAERIAALCRHKTVILREEYTTGELLSLVGNLDLLIGIRLHALIFAGVMGIPMIGISYDPKIERFLDSIGESSVNSLQEITAAELLAAVDEKWQQKAAFVKKTEKRLSALRRDAFYNAELALGLIEKK
jgi:polysaccharide pyruvyl transferase CsaB